MEVEFFFSFLSFSFYLKIEKKFVRSLFQVNIEVNLRILNFREFYGREDFVFVTIEEKKRKNEKRQEEKNLLVYIALFVFKDDFDEEFFRK